MTDTSEPQSGDDPAPSREAPQDERWYSVRCVIKHGRGHYEERITLFRASSFVHAIALAENEARDYAKTLDSPGNRSKYKGLAQAYLLDDNPGESGSEIFSLIRHSKLSAKKYINRFFDTGAERQGHM